MEATMVMGVTGTDMGMGSVAITAILITAINHQDLSGKGFSAGVRKLNNCLFTKF